MPSSLSWSAVASSLRNSSTSMFGIENGLWEKSIFLSSSFHSNIGKSTIQQKSNRSFAMSPRSSPTLVRAGPANFTNLAGPGPRDLTMGGAPTRHEECPVTYVKSELQTQLLGALGP